MWILFNRVLCTVGLSMRVDKPCNVRTCILMNYVFCYNWSSSINKLIWITHFFVPLIAWDTVVVLFLNSWHMNSWLCELGVSWKLFMEYFNNFFKITHLKSMNKTSRKCSRSSTIFSVTSFRRVVFENGRVR